MPNSRMNKRSSADNSACLQVVAHKSTGGMLNAIPQPVDPVGNASDRLTNNTVALPDQETVDKIMAQTGVFSFLMDTVE